VSARVVAACCLAVLAAACSPTLDTDDIESQIAEQLGGRFPRSTWTVLCPSGVEATVGSTFACEATSDDEQVFTIEVKQDQPEAVTWRIVEG
jgi:Domain of unknown function (DUF4333)